MCFFKRLIPVLTLSHCWKTNRGHAICRHRKTSILRSSIIWLSQRWASSQIVNGLYHCLEKTFWYNFIKGRVFFYSSLAFFFFFAFPTTTLGFTLTQNPPLQPFFFSLHYEARALSWNCLILMLWLFAATHIKCSICCGVFLIKPLQNCWSSLANLGSPGRPFGYLSTVFARQSRSLAQCPAWCTLFAKHTLGG